MARLAAASYAFGDFRLDCERFELLQNGRAVRLERKPMELLILLLARDGQLVTRAEIAAHLWSSEVFVDTEHGINTATRKIRQVLGDDPENPRFVMTVTGKGYRFSGPIVRIALAESPMISAPAAAPVPKRRLAAWYVGAAVSVAIAVAALALYRYQHRRHEITYSQITDFTDSAVAPALSPDGRMLAFIRSSDTFMSTDQIYMKVLPNGEAKRVSEDGRPKYGRAFSPDGSEIAYTTLEGSVFSTYAVSVLGGESHLPLRNSAGLVWLEPQRLLFSEVRPGEGIHMGVVTATPTRTGLKEIYFPAHDRGMAHYSFPSPDRRWALVVEMNGDGDWAPCRLISLDGQAQSKSIGPDGSCTSAAWSRDGSWMYFSAAVGGRSHLWRQHFPDGQPEQLTFGPTEEDGVVAEPTGRALITSVGVHESAIWLHDPNGERALSSEGEVMDGLSPPTFSPDGTMIYYLLRRGQEGEGAELWRTWVASGKSEAVFPGVTMTAYDVSPDGKEVVYTTSGGSSQLWLAPIDRSVPASKVGNRGALRPYFGARGKVLIQQTEGDSNFLEQVNTDGSNESKVATYPILQVLGISPGRRWVITAVAKAPGDDTPAVVAIPVDGGTPRRICASYCVATWTTSGNFIVVQVELPSLTGPGRSLAIPVGPGENLPELPPGGIAPLAEPSTVKGTQSVARASLVPGKDPEHFAYVNNTVHRNLYRVTLP